MSARLLGSWLILMGLIGVVVPTVRRQNFYVEEVRMMK
jgi:hypothetical protein